MTPPFMTHVTRDQPIDQPRGIGPGHHVLEERRHVDQRRGIPDGVVLVLVVALVGADGVIPRPLAVIQAFTERKGALVEGSPDRHGWIIITILMLSMGSAARLHALLLENQTRAAGLS